MRGTAPGFPLGTDTREDLRSTQLPNARWRVSNWLASESINQSFVVAQHHPVAAAPNDGGRSSMAAPNNLFGVAPMWKVRVPPAVSSA